MKIPESIIEKYNLTPSGEQIGESFMQNQLLFKSDLHVFSRVVFMECDFTGKPCPYINLFNKDSGLCAAVTSEYLNETPFDTVLNLVTVRST
jgi:hypothetical protein